MPMPFKTKESGRPSLKLYVDCYQYPLYDGTHLRMSPSFMQVDLGESIAEKGCVIADSLKKAQ